MLFGNRDLISGQDSEKNAPKLVKIGLLVQLLLNKLNLCTFWPFVSLRLVWAVWNVKSLIKVENIVAKRADLADKWFIGSNFLG